MGRGKATSWPCGWAGSWRAGKIRPGPAGITMQAGASGQCGLCGGSHGSRAPAPFMGGRREPGGWRSGQGTWEARSCPADPHPKGLPCKRPVSWESHLSCWEAGGRKAPHSPGKRVEIPWKSHRDQRWALGQHGRVGNRDMVQPQWEPYPVQTPRARPPRRTRSDRSVSAGAGSCWLSCSRPHSPNGTNGFAFFLNQIKFCNT